MYLVRDKLKYTTLLSPSIWLYALVGDMSFSDHRDGICYPKQQVEFSGLKNKVGDRAMPSGFVMDAIVVVHPFHRI